MPTTPRLALPYPQLSDNADVPEDITALANSLDIAVIYGQSALASRPTSSPGTPGIAGRFWYATDDGHLYYDHGTGWLDMGPVELGEDSIDSFELAPDSVTSVELADHASTDALRAVTTNHIRDSAVTEPKLGAGAVTAAKVSSTLKPSGGAGSGTEALRALGTAAGTAAAGSHKTQHAPAGADPIDYTLVHLAGLFASRPAASSGNAGLLYFATDTGALFRSNGSAWVQILAADPVGTIKGYAVNTPPTGWLMCDGSAVSRTTYSELFTLLNNVGLPYGTGDGSTTFNVPDLRGRVPVGRSAGGKAEVDTLGENEGLTANLRNVKHTHTVWKRGITDGGQDIYGGQNFAIGSSTINGIDNDNVDKPAYLVINYIIKF
jgi:microcystin-dependent protein